MIISTRESKETRERVLDLGISQISGASKTSVGGYSEEDKSSSEGSDQFELADNRTLDEIVNWLMKMDHIPSFCTACYRQGRTGDRFMSLVKAGQLGNVCQPNALITLQEYLLDYASPDTRTLGEKVIEKNLSKITSDEIRENVSQWLEEIKAGRRDIRL